MNEKKHVKIQIKRSQTQQPTVKGKKKLKKQLFCFLKCNCVHVRAFCQLKCHIESLISYVNKIILDDQTISVEPPKKP